MDYNIIIIIHEPKIGSIKHQSSKTCPDRKWNRMNWFFILSYPKLKAQVVIYSQEFIFHRSSLPQQQKSWTVVSRPSNHENMFHCPQIYVTGRPHPKPHVMCSGAREKTICYTLLYGNADFRVGIWLKPIDGGNYATMLLFMLITGTDAFPRLTPVSCLYPKG